ncbi:MAG TPA: choice-of-anchor Q domain-containing protein [Candidatus Angelobacter sp.]|nr:choice-of-anchor Q domain-containing protein [Candidatus Angelobacter sp.]
MKFLLSLALLLVLPLSLAAQSPPRIFFSDLESGPNIGGQKNLGVWVTIWGKGFGAERGASTVTIGGGAAADYPIWTDTKITFQLGPAAKTGPIVVNLKGKSGSGASNALPFTVRAGKIYFVAVNGSDWRNGSFQTPWKTIVHAKDRMSAGDVTYIKDGVAQTSEDHFTAYLSMDRDGGNNSGKPGAPKALVAYPGAHATIGKAYGLDYGIRTPNIQARADYWAISQLHIIGGKQAIDMGGMGWKIVGNDIECPGGDGQVGCVQASGASGIKFYGNEVHNAGAGTVASKFYHAVYFSTDSNHIDVGWNHIHDNMTCRAVQFHSSPLCRPDCGARDQTGHDQFDLHVHDNLIHGDSCNGINFATVDPSKGPVEAYNNVIYHVGVADPKDGGGAFSCIYVAGITNTGPAGTGTVEVFNNTLYDCAANRSRNADGSRGAFSVGAAGLTMRLRNNIVYQLPGEVYLDGNKAQITGEKNLCFGAGNGPEQTAGNINADPQFVDLGKFDFHLRGASPAKDSGVAVLPDNPFVMSKSGATDKDGVARPQGKAFDLGAYEAPE